MNSPRDNLKEETLKHLTAANELIGTRRSEDRLRQHVDTLLRLQSEVKECRILVHATCLRLSFGVKIPDLQTYVRETAAQANQLIRHVLETRPPSSAEEFAAYGVLYHHKAFSSPNKEHDEFYILKRANAYLKTCPVETLGAAFARRIVCALSDDFSAVKDTLEGVRRHGGYIDIHESHISMSHNGKAREVLPELEKALPLMERAHDHLRSAFWEHQAFAIVRAFDAERHHMSSREEWLEAAEAYEEKLLRCLDAISGSPNAEGNRATILFALAKFYVMCEQRTDAARRADEAMALFQSLGQEGAYIEVAKLKRYIQSRS